jgi:hypothetical protein
VSDFDDVLDVDGADDVALYQDIKELIIRAESERPRSLQRVPGPSEVGHPCELKVAYTVNRARTDHKEAQGYNSNSDPMAAIIGTATHAWLEDAADKANKRLGRVRWSTEQQVIVRPSGPKQEQLAGTCDLYDFDTKTVLDWKVPGPTMYAKYAKNGPSEQYRNQAHLYGQGFINLGFEVRHVGIIFISRTGTLRQTHLWREEYNQTRVDNVLATLDHIEHELNQMGTDFNPDAFSMTSGDYCGYCPWFSVHPEGPFQCKGNA